jgi:hypothetical protein
MAKEVKGTRGSAWFEGLHARDRILSGLFHGRSIIVQVSRLVVKSMQDRGRI